MTIYRINLICCHTSQGAEESIVSAAVAALTLCHSQCSYDLSSMFWAVLIRATQNFVKKKIKGDCNSV
jgi:hypothetical protein